MEISFGPSGDSFAQIVTAWAALMAAILGPAAGYLAARHQARRSVVSNHRQAWVDALRSEVAELIAVSGDLVRALKNDPIDNALKNDLDAQTRLLTARVSLRLNRDDERQEFMLAALNACLKAARTGSDDYIDLRRDALTATRIVLKAEWEAVKRGR